MCIIIHFSVFVSICFFGSGKGKKDHRTGTQNDSFLRRFVVETPELGSRVLSRRGSRALTEPFHSTDNDPHRRSVVPRIPRRRLPVENR